MANEEQRMMISKERWLKELEKFPDVKQLKINLQQLFQLDKSNLSVSEIETLFYKTAIVYPFGAVEYPSSIFNSFPIWRCRININEAFENTSLLKTYSYPDPKFCSKNGRANLAGRSVFYCAHNGTTAIFETKPVEGDILYLTKWTVASNRNVLIMNFLPVDIPSTNPFFASARRLFDQQIAFHDINGGQKGEHLKAVTSFVSQSFVDEKEPYHLTSWLADRALYESNGVDVLVYPSIPRKFVSCNFVIRRDFVDSFLQMKTVFKLHVNYCDGEILHYKLLETGDCINDKVIWRESTEDDEKLLPGK